ncbi:zinc finger protein 271-like [Uloborus diversus]|uniref:zinc finger protein 271-like n=1 Tax=Uloborus diversus TaxID=327109 RepID=UPI0024095DCF|nr:zinc finger protein 271-like [Uloborus diversus]
MGEMSFPLLENKIKVLPHSCFICSKAFVRKNTLLKHYREHTKELGPDLEHLEEQRARYLERKNGTHVPEEEELHQQQQQQPTHILPDQQQDADHNVIQNLDSNDIIITTLYSNNVMVQAIDPISIVQCLDPGNIVQNLSPEAFPLLDAAHECGECKASFSSAEALRRHSLIHDRHQTFSCDTCCAVFPSKNELRTHDAIHRRHTCADCDGSFETRGELERHRLSHKGNPGSYVCDVCFNDFASKKSLKVHARVHKLESQTREKYICEFCAEMFEEESDLKLHYLSHPEERPFVCEVCNDSFADCGAYEKHRLKHAGPEHEFCCPLCDEYLATERELHLHKLGHDFSRKTNNSCDVCSKKFKSKADYDKHKEMHMKQKIFVCSVCDDAFREKSEYEKHKRKHLKRGRGKKGEDVVCEICDESVASDEYENHLFMHGEGKTHTCRICSETFMFKDDLAQHTRTAHVADRPFSCNICDESFRFKSDLREHRQVHGRKKPNRVEEYEISKPKRKPRSRKSSAVEEDSFSQGRLPDQILELAASCRHCRSEFGSKAELSEHADSCPKGRPHLCKNCDRRFRSKEELLVHKKVHSRRQPFICKVCNEGFRCREALEEHGATHDTSPTFPCNICEAVFPTREALREHKQGDHSGEIAYICSVCEATFEEKAEFRAHRATHGVIPHQCKVCGETFGERRELKRHYLKHILERPNLCRICNAPFVQWAALRSHYLGHTRN